MSTLKTPVSPDPPRLPSAVVNYGSNLVLRALAQLSPGAPKDALVERVEVLRFKPCKGAFILRFWHPNTALPSTLRIYPFAARADEALGVAFDATEKEPSGLLPIEEDNAKRHALFAALRGLERYPSDVRGIRFPAHFAPAADAIAAVQTLAEQNTVHGDDDEDDYGDLEITFSSLATDVLCGVALREQAASPAAASFAVWAATDATTTVILRFYDKGASTAFAGYVAPTAEQSHYKTIFEALVNKLEELTQPRDHLDEITACLPGFVLLPVNEACARLAHVMAARVEENGILFEPGISGLPSQETLERLDLLEETTEADGYFEPSPTLFEMLSHTYFSNIKQYRWSPDKEAANKARMEVLEHIRYPGVVVLVGFQDTQKTPDIAMYVPEGVEVENEPLGVDLGVMISDRQFGGPLPRPLPTQSPFRPIPAAKVTKLLKACNAAFLKGLAFEVPIQSEQMQAAFENAARKILDNRLKDSRSHRLH